MICIIRHGRTEMNDRHVLQGRSDCPMNAKGIAQAGAAARALARMGVVFGRVFSSPLARAVQTAAIVAPGVAAVLDDRLIEMEYGPWEGMDLRAPAPELAAFFSDFVHNPAPKGMESLASVTARTGAFLEEIRPLDGNILISTHAIAMKGILECLTPGSNGSFWPKHIGNCAVYAAENGQGGFGVPREIYRSGE
ncbi:MAG: histidine phosphatase family protein [Clostridia bacterium]|nr:histidine phosphatase family protein [Clostridia bacterium]